MEERVKELEEGIYALIESIDYHVSMIERDFEENNDDIRHGAGRVYLNGQLKVYKHIRESLEIILERAGE